MAQTEILAGNALAIKRWSQFMSREALKKTYIKRFMGTGPHSVIQLHRDVSKDRGDQVQYDLLARLDGYGVKGSARLKGQEKALSYFSQTMGIDQLREGINYDSMSQQRTLHELREDGVMQLSDWAARVMDETAMASLAGTAGDNTALNTQMNGFGGNAFNAPDTAHVYAPGSAMTIDHIRILVERATRLDPPIRPTMVDGKPYYVLLLRPEAVTSMKNQGGTSKWREITALAQIRGAQNPIFTGALGEFDGVVMHEAPYLPRTAAGNLNYNLFLGEQAGHIAFGNPYARLGRKPTTKMEFFAVFDDVDDYGDKTGVAVSAIWGFQKSTFNALDFGLIRLTTVDVQT